MDELEAKNSFLLEKGNKLKAELKEQRKEHQEAIDKLNSALLFNQKLEKYVGHLGDVVNKTRLFDEVLAKHPVSAVKVIPVLVDFVEKMEELLDDMKILFEGLQPDVPPIAIENLSNILGKIPSLTGWGRETVPTETPTKPDQPGTSMLIREEKEGEAPPQPEYASPSRRQVAEVMTREVQVNTIIEEVIKELQEEQSQPNRMETPRWPA